MFTKAEPLQLATWPIALAAVGAAWPALGAGGPAVDAVEAACRFAESDPSNHTVGVGGLPDRDGHVSLDAAIMLSPARRAGVAEVRDFAHPISLARRAMDRTPHTLIVGDGAGAFADAQRFERADLLTARARRHWERWRAQHLAAGGAPDAAGAPMANFEADVSFAEHPVAAAADRDEHHDTIGTIALDARGTLAAACSTSGLPWKIPGRVGDSPIIGHGLYCDPGVGACVATGHGELISGICGAFLAVESLDRGASPLEAATFVLQRIADRFPLTDRDQIGLIVVDAAGRFATASLRPGYQTALGTRDGVTLLKPGRVLLDD